MSYYISTSIKHWEEKKKKKTHCTTVHYNTNVKFTAAKLLARTSDVGYTLDQNSIPPESLRQNRLIQQKYYNKFSL